MHYDFWLKTKNARYQCLTTIILIPVCSASDSYLRNSVYSKRDIEVVNYVSHTDEWTRLPRNHTNGFGVFAVSQATSSSFFVDFDRIWQKMLFEIAEIPNDVFMKNPKGHPRYPLRRSQLVASKQPAFRYEIWRNHRRTNYLTQTSSPRWRFILTGWTHMKWSDRAYVAWSADHLRVWDLHDVGSRSKKSSFYSMHEIRPVGLRRNMDERGGLVFELWYLLE